MTETEGTLLTSAALQKLRDELDQLTTTGRDEVVARIAEARSHGDLKENSEYDTAKNDQGLMEARIRQLKHTIDNAQILEVDDSDFVTIGSVASVIDDDGDEMDIFIAASENRFPGCFSLHQTVLSALRSWERRLATMSTMKHQVERSSIRCCRFAPIRADRIVHG